MPRDITRALSALNAQHKKEKQMNLEGFEVVELAKSTGGRAESVPAVTITDKGRIVLSGASSKEVADGKYSHATLLWDPKVTEGFRLALRFTPAMDKSIKPENQAPVQINAKTGIVGLALATTLRNNVKYPFVTNGTQRFLVADQGKTKAGALCMEFRVGTNLKPPVKPVRKPKAEAAPKVASATVGTEAPALSQSDVAA